MVYFVVSILLALIAVISDCIKPREVIKFLILMTAFLYISRQITEIVAETIEWKIKIRQ